MTVQTIKRMLDACYQAKRIREMLPALPSGVTPSYIHFLDVIQIMERQGVAVKISDISDYLNIPRPGVTRTVKEMEEKGAEIHRNFLNNLSEKGVHIIENNVKILEDASLCHVEGSAVGEGAIGQLRPAELIPAEN